jgi:hypothetical protein
VSPAMTYERRDAATVLEKWYLQISKFVVEREH